MDNGLGASASADRATTPSEPSPETVSGKAGIPCADTENYAPIWRSGLGAAVEAVDAFRREHRMSRRMTPSERAYDALLDKVLQDISEESRAPWDIPNYRNASDCSRCLVRAVAERRGPTGTPQVSA
jgi:hypothetical protein